MNKPDESVDFTLPAGKMGEFDILGVLFASVPPGRTSGVDLPLDVGDKIVDTLVLDGLFESEGPGINGEDGVLDSALAGDASDLDLALSSTGDASFLRRFVRARCASVEEEAAFLVSGVLDSSLPLLRFLRAAAGIFFASDLSDIFCVTGTTVCPSCVVSL